MAADQITSQSQHIEKDPGANGLEMVEHAPASSDGDHGPVGEPSIEVEGEREERVTAKAWLCVFVS